MIEDYMTSKTTSHLRTFHVEMCSTRETQARTFSRGRNYASVKDFEDPKTENGTVEHR